MQNNSKRIAVIERPLLEQAEAIIRKSISEHRGLLVVGLCEVNYRGRASSKLETGDRIIVVKEDGAILVHRPTDYSPVNWQPPGSLFETRLQKDGLLLTAVRRRPREVLRILFGQIYSIAVLSLVDTGDFSLFASEGEMRDAISADPSLVEDGLRIISIEKKIEPGFVDLYGIDNQRRLVLIEVKRRTAGKDAVLQLAKYLETIRSSINRDARGILVAPDIAKGAQALLATLKLEFKPLSPKRCAEVLNTTKTASILEWLGGERG